MADAAAAALHAPSGAFNVVAGEPLTKRQYANALADAAGKACGCVVLAGLHCSSLIASASAARTYGGR
jgi:nucleoside-diphosphate-sugar epimerase